MSLVMELGFFEHFGYLYSPLDFEMSEHTLEKCCENSLSTILFKFQKTFMTQCGMKFHFVLDE